MIKNIAYLRGRYIFKGSFGANVLTLMTGTTIAQAIPIAISPILTRIYTPQDFGIFALYTAIATIIGVAATGRYELAIMLPEKDEDAFLVATISFFISSIISLVTLIIMWRFNDSITDALGNISISGWLYFVPISVLITGAYQSFYYYANRNKQYTRISLNRMLQSGTSAGAQVGLGFGGAGAIGLLAGGIAGQGIATGVLGLQIWREDERYKSTINKKSFIETMKRYVNFPRYSLPAGLLNVISNQLPVFLLGSFFGGTVVGFYALTRRVIAAPTGLIANSILDVFKQRASSDYAKYGECRSIYIKTFKSLVLLSALPCVAFFFIAPALFAFIFGKEWQIAGEYARILTVLLFFGFVASPLSYVIYIAEKQNYDLVWQIALFLITIASFLTGKYASDVKAGLWCFSLGYSLLYIIYLYLSYKVSKGGK